eukprot:jgi/Astpho2/115/Aster-x0892
MASQPAHGKTASRLAQMGYNLFMKRNSTYIAFVFAGALVGERVFNSAFDSMWEANNRGKLFKDVEAKVKAGGDEGGEDE